MNNIDINTIINIIISETGTDEIKADTELIDSGIIDSFDMISLISEFDEAFDLEIEVSDIDIDNFKKPNQIKETLVKIKERNA